MCSDKQTKALEFKQRLKRAQFLMHSEEVKRVQTLIRMLENAKYQVIVDIISADIVEMIKNASGEMNTSNSSSDGNYESE